MTANLHPLRDARLIGAAVDRDTAPRLRGLVALEQDRADIVSATLAVTAHGVYEAFIDGESVTESVLNPGWTAYEWRLAYQSFDVTNALAQGRGNVVALSFVVGNGWYRGDLGFARANANYGEEIGVAGALEITYRDGETQRVVTAGDWEAEASETTRNSLYNGQTIDARLRRTRRPVATTSVALDTSTVVAQTAPLIVRNEVLTPTRVWKAPSGRTLVDFGQNLVGWVRFTTQGQAGAQIRIRHAEVLEHDELGVRPLRGAEATDVFVLSGEVDTFEPTLTFHGFRYIEIDGWPDELTSTALEAVVVHSDMRRTGRFACSDPLVNQLIHNSVWGQKGNFLSVPTDCPQRDERLGWTGDIAAYAASAAFQFDTADFLDGWLRDLRAETEHSEGGFVPLTVPDVLKYANFPDGFTLPWHRATAVWGDAAVWVPQALWTAYGDLEQLAEHYPAMTMHLHSIAQDVSRDGLWTGGQQLGDWLDPDAPPEDPGAAKADPAVVATACLYRSASFAAEAARQLGKSDDEEHWSALAERTQSAFTQHYVDETGWIQSDCATVYALAIAFGLLDGTTRKLAGDRLAELVVQSDYRVTTGFAGTPFVTWALSLTGHVDEAYRLLLERECPSWLYSVTMGATTIWERWDSMLPDGSINAGEMTSFNHYALGAVADWIYQVVGGIRPAAPGYARVRIEPQPGPGIDWVETSYDSIHGTINCAWKVVADTFELAVSIPEGIPADVILPDGRVLEVVGGSHDFRSAFAATEVSR
ncbi:glycoside hydrolase family 78 protein [Microbacterium terricola]|nr:glycoside hydrolase family 78 protein [Microbacterium terricola]UYK40028.1 glycoside hydrolase family 78 protein [Microbacterium terricola]